MPARKVEYQEFLERVYEETNDPEWNIANHPGRKLLERFDGPFHLWLNWLYEMLSIKRGGYPFAKDDLSFQGWKCLGILECYSTPAPLEIPPKNRGG